jgi:hypothetical protein
MWATLATRAASTATFAAILDAFPAGFNSDRWVYFGDVQAELTRLGWREASIVDCLDDQDFDEVFAAGASIARPRCWHCQEETYWIARFIRGDAIRRYIVCVGCQDAEMAEEGEIR